MKFKILLTLFISSCFYSSIAQQNEQQIHNQKTAYQEAAELKEGVLLVRLFTRSKGIEAYRKNGATAYADKLEKEVRASNLDLLDAFKKEFRFCKVAFFYSQDSELVKARNYAQVTFLNDSLMPDMTVNPAEFKSVFIGELSNIEKTNEQSGQTDRGFSAFIIRDANFRQLKKPFPYYQRSYSGVFFINRKIDTVVRKLQAKLETFHH